MFLEYISVGYTVLLFSFFIILLHVYTSRNFGYWKKKNVFYFKPIPFFGNFLHIILSRRTIGDYFLKLYEATKEPFFGIYLMDTPCLIIRSPELIKSVLVKDFKYFADRAIALPNHDPMISSMLLLSKNPEWKVLRNKMSPVFTSGKLKNMVPLINDCGEAMNHYLVKKSLQSSTEAKEVCAKYATDVVAKCAFGINAHCFEDENADFRKIGRMIFDSNWSTAFQQTAYFFLPTIVKIFRLTFIPPDVSSFLRNCFWDTIRKREAANARGNDLIDTIIMVKNSKISGKELNFEGDRVLAQAVQFFAAGLETISSTMSFTLYELAIHPKVQKRARAEITSCLEKHGGFTYEAIQAMTYLDMCVSEALRKYPVLPFLDRRCNENYKIPGSDVIIEKGTPVYIPMFSLHYDEQYFPDPQSYNPERFSESNSSKLTPFTYIPFGEGPRICIGERFGLLSTKLGLAHILSEYEVEKSDETPMKLEFEPIAFFLISKVGLPVRFKRPGSTVG